MADPWAEYERLSQEDVSRLSPSERRLVAFGAMRADLNNGGFDQYFFNSAGDLVAEAIEAARTAGAADLAALLERAITLLGVPEPAERVARQERLDEIDEDAFEALDAEYQAIEAASNLDSTMGQLAQ